MQGHQGYPDTLVQTKSPTEAVISGGGSLDFCFTSGTSSGCRRGERSSYFQPVAAFYAVANSNNQQMCSTFTQQCKKLKVAIIRILSDQQK